MYSIHQKIIKYFNIPKEVFLARLLILISLVFLLFFTFIFFQPKNQGYSWLFILLSISVVFKLLRLLHEWYHCWNVIPPTPPVSTRTWTVDILTTFCKGEPYDMILNTLKAVQAIKYPHTTYLCDEADDPYLRQVCLEMGVKHVTRTIKIDAKAGNINNALQQATGEICVVLDPDHIPVPDFLDHVLPYFEDPQIGFVQCVQAYYNRKESLVALGAAEQTYSFYGPMMTCMGTYGTAQAIGANCTFRRAALDSIGGHAAGLSEDMHTSMQLHAKDWKSVYVPLPLSCGLVPATLAAYYKQQLKWARGTFELLFTTYPKLFSRLTWRQRIHYFTIPLYYLIGVIQLIDLAIPICSLTMQRLPLRLDLGLFAVAYVPLLVISFLIRQYSQRWLTERHEVGFHIIGGLLTSGTWFIYVLGLIYTLLRVDVPYLPTPKNDRPRNNFLLCLPNILVCAATLGAILYSLYYYGNLSLGNIYFRMMIAFALVNVAIQGINVLIGQERLLAWIKNSIQQSSFRQSSRWSQGVALWRTRYGIYGWLRLPTFQLYGTLVILIIVLVSFTYEGTIGLRPVDIKHANTQPFYFGDESNALYQQVTAKSPDLVIYPQHLAWSPTAGSSIARPKWRAQQNELPLLYLEPALTVTDSTMAVGVFLSGILHGQYDQALTRFIQKVIQYDRPVLVSFAPYFDDVSQPWGTQREKDLVNYREAFQYLARFCQLNKVTNITWVWCPTQENTISTFYPGKDNIDWIGLKIINDPIKSSEKESHSFATLYQPFQQAISGHPSASIQEKPILITRLETAVPNEQTDWERNALNSMYERFPEIKGVVLSNNSFKTAPTTRLLPVD
ncbi:glycosyltransferase [Spirosoma aerophilum]